jgi:hypothetical protein
VIFDKSLFADLNYTKQFFQGSEYQIANFDYYHAKVREWATRKEVKRDEQGWRDTFQNWIFKDSNRGELRTINNKIGHAINKPSTAGKQTAQSFADIEARYS